MTPEKLKQRRIDLGKMKKARNDSGQFLILPPLESWSYDPEKARDAARFWMSNVRPGTNFGLYSRQPTIWQKFCDWISGRLKQ